MVSAILEYSLNSSLGRYPRYPGAQPKVWQEIDCKGVPPPPWGFSAPINVREMTALSLSLDLSYSPSKKECGDNRGASDHTRSFTRATHQIILPGKWSPEPTKTDRKGNYKNLDYEKNVETANLCSGH